jgi:LysR family hydrogen peroxide-inducible transcriptional activator
MNFSLAQLQYIVALDTYRHYVNAAENCYVTQPTLSMQIKKMEEELGVILFDRSKQPVVPTEVGVRVVAKARDILRHSEKIYDVIDDHKGAVKGELIIGILPTLAPYLLPLFIGKFSRAYPDLKIRVKEYQTDEIVRLLNKDYLDVGILATPLNEPGLKEKPIFYDEFKVYVGENSRYSNETVKVEDLLKEKIWLLTEGNCFRTQSINLCGMSQTDPEVANFDYESGSIQTLVNIVDREGGITFIPEIAALDIRKKQQHKIKTIKSKKPPVREVSLVFTRNYAKKRLVNLLYDVIKEVLPPELDKDHFDLVTL